MGDFGGGYRIEGAGPPVVITMTREGERLFDGAAKQVELFAPSEHTFFAVEDAITITFLRDAAGRVSGIRSDQAWRADRTTVGNRR